MPNLNAFACREDGQTVVETSVGLVLLCLMTALTINLYYFIEYAQTIMSSAYTGASMAAVSSGSSSFALAAAQSEAANSSLNPKVPAATVSVCSPSLGVNGDAAVCSSGGAAGFVDPEAASDGSTGQFYASSASTTQSFTAFMQRSLLGESLIPGLTPGPLTKTFYVRAMGAVTPGLSGAH